MKASNISKISLIIITTLIVYSNVIFTSLNQVNSKNLKTSFNIRENDNTFIGTINENQYVFSYISEENIQETKRNLKLREVELNSKAVYNGHGTGLEAPSDKELNNLIGKKWIKSVVSKPQDNPSGASYDLSSQSYFPQVGDQQGQGSCAAWSITYYVYGYLEAKDYGWNASAGEATHLMSPAWTYNKVATSNYGSWMSTNAQIMIDWGCATLATMPYDDTDYYSWGDESAYREAIHHRPLDYYLMDFDEDNPNTTVDAIKSFILSETPITFAMHAGEFNPSFSDGNYIMSSTEYDATSLNHAQTIVGFNDTITDDGDVGAFKVVNSWGTSFGDEGYYWITYECLKEIGLVLGDFGIHLCVLTDRLDYQPSLVATWEFDPAPTRGNSIITLGIGQYNDPIASINPWYKVDNTYSFPNFMALDISQFNSQYELDNKQWFQLEVGSSTTSGIISSFLIERYVDGVLETITNESRDVPQSSPCLVFNTFMNIDHDLKVLLETPLRSEINMVYSINATILNNGIYNETDLNLYLCLGGVVIESKYIAELSVGANDTIEYTWEPLEYGRYNFSCYVPPLINEEHTIDNTAQKLIIIPKITLFNGLYINYTCNLGTFNADSQVSYNQSFNSFFDVNWELNISNSFYISNWDVDGATRIIENSSGSFTFGHGYHSPFWIFREIELGDMIPIASRYGYDFEFTVVDKIIHEIPGSGLVEIWVLEETEDNGGKAYYERSTGILWNGTFINNILSNDSYTFVDTNANFTYVFFPSEFYLTSDAASPDKDGSFVLTWNISDKAIDYSVYQHSSHINMINDSLISLVEHSKSLSFQLDDYHDGTYYFIVEACNDIGTVLSNCIEVQIQIDENLIQWGESLMLILGGVGMLATVGIAILLIHKRKTNRIE